MTGVPATRSGSRPSGGAAGASPAEPSIPNAGPWHTKRYGYEKHAILDERGTDIAFAHRAKDAHLIAAAPDMYESAYEFLKAWGNGETRESAAHLAIELGRALRKARGEA